jgi:hypothetical protein
MQHPPGHAQQQTQAQQPPSHSPPTAGQHSAQTGKSGRRQHKCF